ncbi:MAG: hypothetical protein ONB06_11380, partial [candidate division KSB1 bacterium]|nr:hypothetical protein [candidate division KSB1 bacterium]
MRGDHQDIACRHRPTPQGAQSQCRDTLTGLVQQGQADMMALREGHVALLRCWEWYAICRAHVGV